MTENGVCCMLLHCNTAQVYRVNDKTKVIFTLCVMQQRIAYAVNYT
jgi:hypothetical protein